MPQVFCVVVLGTGALTPTVGREELIQLVAGSQNDSWDQKMDRAHGSECRAETRRAVSCPDNSSSEVDDLGAEARNSVAMPAELIRRRGGFLTLERGAASITGMHIQVPQTGPFPISGVVEVGMFHAVFTDSLG